MKRVVIFVVLLYCSIMGSAQAPCAVKGIAADTTEKDNLENTSIVIINQKDSFLVKFTLSNSRGEFDITNLRPGNYILLLSYPHYADYAEEFVLDSLHLLKDFGRINMTLKSALLQEVIVNGKAAAVKIKGDTTEFNAGSYIIQPNSKVEDLLRQLPGIQVDRNGKITAQGKTVNKVLVDGEEFFGDDPTLVTRNIRGDMVDKIQLYDKKSDRAIFTGIDDGKREKTINVKLKEDKKNGYFGKILASYGTKKFHEAQAMINIFRGREKIAAYGAISNTGSLGLNSTDAGKYSNNDEFTYVSNGLGAKMIDPESFQGTYDGRGLPLATGAGLHYENKWDEDKYGLNSNYRLGSLKVTGAGNEYTVNTLPGETTTTNSDRTFTRNAFRQKADGKMTILPDSLSAIRISINGSLSNSSSNEAFTTYTRRQDSSFQNKGERTLTNDADNKNFDATASWNRRLARPGRTISVNVRQSAVLQQSIGLLQSFNQFFDTGNAILDSARIDQYKTARNSTQTFNSNIIYTEPINKALRVMLNFGLNISKGKSWQQSFNKDGSGHYSSLDTAFSSHFELGQFSGVGGVVFNYAGKKSL